MSKDGIVHEVYDNHIADVMNDYNLHEETNELCPCLEDEDLDICWERLETYVLNFMKKNKILQLVFDVPNKIVYVRGHKNDPTPLQREKLIDFCISKNSELIYDPNKYA